MMDFPTVKYALDSAAWSLIRNESDMFNKHVHEQSITAKFMYYLTPLFPHFNVDCEYNREGIQPKKACDGSLRRPDVIVHKRGNNKQNLLVIEVKTHGHKNQVEEDKSKMREMLDEPKSYQYAFMMIVNCGPGSPAITFERVVTKSKESETWTVKSNSF